MVTTKKAKLRTTLLDAAHCLLAPYSRCESQGQLHGSYSGGERISAFARNQVAMMVAWQLTRFIAFDYWVIYL